MKYIVSRLSVALALSLLAAVAFSAPVTMTSFSGVDYNTFSVTGSVTAQLVNNYDNNNSGFTKGTVYSQVFQLTNGNYLYLYQALNTGRGSISVFNVVPFVNIISSGFLTANVPTGFVVGDKAPYFSGGVYSATYDSVTINVSFGFASTSAISQNKYSNVLFLVSYEDPTSGQVNLTQSGIASVGTFVSPEPSTIYILAASLIGLRLRKRISS